MSEHAPRAAEVIVLELRRKPGRDPLDFHERTLQQCLDPEESHQLVTGLIYGSYNSNQTVHHYAPKRSSIPSQRSELPFLLQLANLPGDFLVLMEQENSTIEMHTEYGSCPQPDAINYVLTFRLDPEAVDQLTLLIHYEIPTGLSTAILLCFPEGECFKHFPQRFKAMQHQRLWMLPMCMPLLVLEALVGFTHSVIKDHHKYISRLEESAKKTVESKSNLQKLDFLRLTRDLNNLRDFVGKSERRLNSVVDMAKVCQTYTTAWPRSCDAQDPIALDQQRCLLLERFDNLKNKCGLLLHQVSLAQNRIDMMQPVIYNFMALKEGQITQKIATTSMRDGSSMKAIAILTMFFLPGTFVATLFQLPVIVVSPPPGHRVGFGFALYWIVAVSLTLCVFGAWVLWLRREKVRLGLHDGRAGRESF